MNYYDARETRDPAARERDLLARLPDQIAQHFGLDLRAEALLDHLGRHLARTEAIDPRGARDLAQATADGGFQLLGRQAEVDAALEVAGGFDGNLHDGLAPAATAAGRGGNRCW